MLFVVDFNIVFSALINKGVPFNIFTKNAIDNRLEFIGPEFLLEEVSNNKNRLLGSTKLTLEEFDNTLSFIFEQIKLISAEEFLDKLSEAIELNPKDSPYLALAMRFNCPILSGDKELRAQTKVKVLSPREVLDMSFSDKSPA